MSLFSLVFSHEPKYWTIWNFNLIMVLTEILRNHQTPKLFHFIWNWTWLFMAIHLIVAICCHSLFQRTADSGSGDGVGHWHVLSLPANQSHEKLFTAAWRVSSGFHFWGSVSLVHNKPLMSITNPKTLVGILIKWWGKDAFKHLCSCFKYTTGNILQQFYFSQYSLIWHAMTSSNKWVNMFWRKYICSLIMFFHKSNEDMSLIYIQ